MHSRQKRALIEKMQTLPPDKLAEIEDFIDFLQQRELDRQLVEAAAQTSEGSLREVWDNPDDAEYDKL
jgi:hypothetical protein